VVCLEIQEWSSLQQESYGVAGCVDSQDADADQVLAPSAEDKDEANGGWYAELNLGEYCLCSLVGF